MWCVLTNLHCIASGGNFNIEHEPQVNQANRTAMRVSKNCTYLLCQLPIVIQLLEFLLWHI